MYSNTRHKFEKVMIVYVGEKQIKFKELPGGLHGRGSNDKEKEKITNK